MIGGCWVRWVSGADAVEAGGARVGRGGGDTDIRVLPLSRRHVDSRQRGRWAMATSMDTSTDYLAFPPSQQHHPHLTISQPSDGLTFGDGSIPPPTDLRFRDSAAMDIQSMAFDTNGSDSFSPSGFISSNSHVDPAQLGHTYSSHNFAQNDPLATPLIQQRNYAESLAPRGRPTIYSRHQSRDRLSCDTSRSSSVSRSGCSTPASSTSHLHSLQNYSNNSSSSSSLHLLASGNSHLNRVATDLNKLRVDHSQLQCRYQQLK